VHAPPRLRRPFLLACLIGAGCAPAAAFDTHRADIRQFIAYMGDHDSFGARKLRKLLAAARSQQAIIDAMDRPAEKTLPWYRYRSIFLNEKRIREGVDFWIAHRRELESSSARTGVAPEYVVAILGVETYYGRRTGQYRVIDALATLAFDYPARAKYFRSELEQFLLLTRDFGIDPLKATGSYAGAMGAPQFMPSTYRRYGLDATDDGHVDLWTDWPDVFDSVGYFLREHGWNTGEPVMSDAAAADGVQAADPRDLKLSDTVASLQAKGVHIDGAPAADAPALLIAADEADGVHWRVGYGNFYAITRYNHSPLYAMAVAELAAAIRQRLPADAPTQAGLTPPEAAADAPRANP